MAEAPSPPSMDIDMVVDLHTNAAAAAAAAALLNETSSNGSSDNGLNIKFPVLYTSSSDTETEDFPIQRNRLHGSGGSGSGGGAASSGGAETVRSSSPPPNCAICLGRCKNKCFTDSCVHQFCFKCLCEWSKVKAECPLCKQAFRSIIHNVKAIDQYEEYLVQQPVVQIPHSPLEVTYQGPLNSGFILNSTRRYYNFSMRSWPTHASGVMGSRGAPLSVRNYMPDDDLSGNNIPSASVPVENLPMSRFELLNLYRQELPDEVSSTMSLGQLWRRYIYDRKLYALPVSDITGRYRESSARFYRNNPGQRIRLMPFANRDIVCLLRNTNHDVSTVLESLNEGLELSNILSRSFRRRLQPFLGERTAHFIHELSNFARSPYDMIGYDRAVQYAPQAADEEHVIEFSTSSEDEAHINNTPSESTTTNNSNTNEATTITTTQRAVRRNAQATSTSSRTRNTGTSEFRVQSRSSAQQSGVNSPMSMLSFTITTTSEGSETPGLSVAVSANSRGHSQMAAINLSTHNRAHNEVVIDLDDTVEINGSNNGDIASGSIVSTNSNTNTTSSTSANINANTNLTANSNIGNNDPALPTSAISNPIREGSPQIVASIALSTSSSDECEFVLERKPPHLRTPEMVSLNSESDSDVVFVEESKPIIAEATYSTSENDEQPSMARLMSEQQDLQEQSTSTGLRPRTVRQLVASKKQSTTTTTIATTATATTAAATTQHRECNSPNKKRRMRTRRMNTPPEYSFDGSTSEDDFKGDDSTYGSRRRPTARKRNNRTRKATTNRKRNPQKRQRLAKPKNETQTKENVDQDSNVTITNSPNMKKRRLNRKRNSIESNKGQKNNSNSTKHTFSSDEDGSSSEEDDKVNLKALQLRLKKSLSDAEENENENEKNDDFNDTPVCSPNTNSDDMSRESNADTANSLNSVNINNININNNNNNSIDNDSNNNNNNINIHSNDNSNGNNVAELTPPKSPQQPTTSAAAAEAAQSAATAAATAATVAAAPSEKETEAAEAIASIYSASLEDSNASYSTSCIASASEVQQEESRAHYRLDSMSPASLSPGSVEPYIPRRLEHPLKMTIESYDRNSTSSNDSRSSLDSYQLPSTSQQYKQKRQMHNYSQSTIQETPTNADIGMNANADTTADLHANNDDDDSDSSNSSANSTASSTTSFSGGSEDAERDSDEDSLA